MSEAPRRKRFQVHLSTAMVLMIAAAGILSANAAEPARAYPLWDGREPVEVYAQRVHLPPTKSLDLGHGVSLDLVLIPAGQFIMGTPEPAEPSITIEGARTLCLGGGVLVLVLMLAFVIKSIRMRKLAFSLLWLVLFIASLGLAAGGYVRMQKADEELSRYVAAFSKYHQLPTDEKPAHAVTITQPFYIGKYTVTQAQYQAVIGRNPSYHKGTQLPVEFICWDDAVAFCVKIKDHFKDKALDVRLPTEAQWEYSCRAGTQTRFYSSDQDSDLDAVAWNSENSGLTTHAVGMKKPNAFGLYDMHGNVWQWCADAYSDHYDDLSATDPFNDGGEYRVMRGGCCWSGPMQCRSASRYCQPHGNANTVYGFRVCMAAEPPTEQ